MTIKAKKAIKDTNKTVPTAISGMLQKDGWRDGSTDEAASVASSKRDSPSVVMKSPAMIEYYEKSVAVVPRMAVILSFRE
jgi:hypothetical protein